MSNVLLKLEMAAPLRYKQRRLQRTVNNMAGVAELSFKYVRCLIPKKESSSVHVNAPYDFLDDRGIP